MYQRNTQRKQIANAQPRQSPLAVAVRRVTSSRSIAANDMDGYRCAGLDDTAHRLTDIRGANGEHIHYTLDALGNRTETSTRDVTGTLKRKHAQVYNLANRLESIKNALGAVVQSFTYDANGNALTHTDANANTTTTTYDALDRVKTVLDAAGGLTRYGYDTGGHLAAVTDPKAAASTAPYATTYLYDGLDNLKTQTSPDTKITSYSYDPAGHVKTKTDARGITASYRYDALGRLTQVIYPSEAPTTYTYDSCTNGKGRLCQITDPSGSTQWGYDLHGRVLSKTQTSGSLTLITRSSYDSAGQLKTVTTPSGNTVTYSYAQGKVTALTSTRGLIMNAMTYDPFGPLKTWTFGNGQSMQRNYNQDGQLDTYTRGGASIDMNYNLTGTVKEQLDLSNSANTQSYGYDALNRLTHFNSSTPTYSYDPNGNRESAVQGSATKDYVIDPASNLLKGIDAITYSYDAVGNTLNDGSHSYQYDERNRLSQIDAGTANELRYVMNALGQRVAKLGTQSPQPGDANSDGRITRDDVYTLNNQLLQRNTAGGNPDCNQDSTINTKDTLCINTKSQSNITNPSSAKTYYAYDEAGHLIGEYDANGNAIQETIWFQDQPVATVKGKNVYFIHTDHLNTPRAISDKNRKIVWTWNSEPFGATSANEDPDTDGEKFVYNLRFPGQVFDAESNLHFNWNRSYSPHAGRYTQVDPIGLRGGLNSFMYANANPVNEIDPLGLWSTAAHEYFIRQAFPNLSESAIAQIIAGSKFADNLFLFQGADSSYMHGMSSDAWPPEEAKKRMCKFISDKMRTYRKQRFYGDSAAYRNLGMALHTVMDTTSPAHRGFQKWQFTDMPVHGPWPTSIEDIAQAKEHRDETVNLMLKAVSGDLSDCGCGK